jgi:hypothetical protein
MAVLGGVLLVTGVGATVAYCSSPPRAATLGPLSVPSQSQSQSQSPPTEAVPVSVAPAPKPSATPPPPPVKPRPTSAGRKASAPVINTTKNLARGRSVKESGHTDVYPGGNVTDGNAKTYWESPKDAFPATVTVDMGTAATLGRVVLKLPPLADWNSRVQTLTLTGSLDGRGYVTLLGPTARTFDAARGNTTTLRFPRKTARYLRVTITANAGWPAGQLSEVEIYGG